MVPVDIPKPIMLESQFKADDQHDQFLVYSCAWLN
ncbi:hypothetical protein LYNGBM3L_24660 [Moorena producens 3L]|uniref:Uncharacterized protein n=1 Tax=Moorena producens 3L TaxID=489825 RepID=F4XMD5_9CYAN|nr:hypothetical protein LYNGBM3L_24660 [Moorena producens 3L]